MSYEDGWAAIHLEMPARVPRTEYSASTHWDLVRTVTGIEVGPGSDKVLQRRASDAFVRAWNYDFVWSVMISSGELKACRTSMGHAEYASGGVDRNNELSCPFSTPEEVLAFDPWAAYGRIDTAEVTRRFQANYDAKMAAQPSYVPQTGIYISMVSGLIEIFGWDMMLLALGTDPAAFGEVANRYSTWIQQYFDALAAADIPCVMVHDDLVWTEGPFVHPDWYRAYVFPNLKRQIAPLRESGKKVFFTSDGNYTMFVDDMAQCGVHGFVMEPLTDMAMVAERYGETHFFVGNADTRVLLNGTHDEIRAEVKRCMDIGKSCPGFFMAVGNHIASNTPVGNALFYNAVYEELARR